MKKVQLKFGSVQCSILKARMKSLAKKDVRFLRDGEVFCKNALDNGAYTDKEKVYIRNLLEYIQNLRKEN